MSKETIYIEPDDEITTVIDKVISSKDNIVAIVLPKRATVFQSAVNVRLLHKSAKEAKKNIVLITSEPAIEAIAGVSGVHVAQSLSSKPVIPKKIAKADSESTISSKELEAEKVVEKTQTDDDEDVVPENEVPADTSSNETIEIDNTDKVVKVKDKTTNKTEKIKKLKGFKVPDFNAFKVKLTLAILLIVLLIAGWVYGFVIMPKATVTINTITNREPITFEFTAKLGIETADYENAVIPAKKAEVTKVENATVPATGEKNVGELATGKVTVTNCSNSSYAIAEGTSFSAGSVSFVSTESTTVPKSGYDFTLSGFECNEDGKKTVDVVATNPGESYNVDAQSYTIGGNPSKVTAFGSEMSGGSDEIVKIVSEDDINKAKEQIAGSAKAGASSELTTQLQDQELQAIAETIDESAPIVKNSAEVGSQAEEVTVTQTVTYSMLGVASSDLGSLLDAKISEKLEDKTDKNVRSNGLDKSAIRLTNKISSDEQVLSIQSVAVLGPEFDQEAIKRDVAGKKRGDIEKMLEARDGIREVDVEYSPMWITTTPKKAEKIIIVINEIEN